MGKIDVSPRHEPSMEGVTLYRPLYRQVYDYLLQQISSSAWRPAQALPSEQALAEQLQVSPGTVRKALDALAAERVIERRQGRGTFVAEQTQERALFRFFRLAEPGGERKTPSSCEEWVKRRRATQSEAHKLELERGEPIVEVKRTRAIDGVPVVLEHSILPLCYFPELDRKQPLPNALYAMFHREYGIHIVSAEEELRAVTATSEDAARLKLDVGAPLLHIERIARALDGRKVEWRISRCDTSRYVYAVSVS